MGNRFNVTYHEFIIIEAGCWVYGSLYILFCFVSASHSSFKNNTRGKDNILI